MRPADEIRAELRQIAETRKTHAKRRVELDAQLARLCREAQEHPELSMAETAKLAGLDRRATAYDYAKKAPKRN